MDNVSRRSSSPYLIVSNSIDTVTFHLKYCSQLVQGIVHYILRELRHVLGQEIFAIQLLENSDKRILVHLGHDGSERSDSSIEIIIRIGIQSSQYCREQKVYSVTV
uniref:Uncharacterized protein n=1 Tax=Cacopsylla melanoneura TaxID=428564 RepID=A0A8D8SDK7_9HEMI